MTGLFQGLLLFFLLGSDVFINYRIKHTHRTSLSTAHPATAAS
jgi:hypothetical protein